jgi:hypothetical protein
LRVAAQKLKTASANPVPLYLCRPEPLRGDSFDELSLEELSFAELSLGELSLDELSFDELSLDALSFEPLSDLDLSFLSFEEESPLLEDPGDDDFLA